MEKRADAKQVDAVEVAAALENGRVRAKAKLAPELGVLAGFLGLFQDRDLDVITAGTLAQEGFDTDYIDASYDNDDVHVSAPNNTLIVPKDAFERLIARLSRAVIDAAKKNGASVTKESWWSKAQDDANAIIKRAYPKGL